MKFKPNQYKAIALWGQKMGSFAYYTAHEQLRAAGDDAPLDAIYQNEDGTWSTVRSIKSVAVRDEMISKLAYYAAVPIN